MSTLYSFSAETLAGAPASLDAYRGKVLLIVNTASECGFTPQYAGLQKLYDQYAARGFYVLGFPCNQFGKQGPATPRRSVRSASAITASRSRCSRRST